MWKRDEAIRPTGPTAAPTPAGTGAGGVSGFSPSSEPEPVVPRSIKDDKRQPERDAVNIGKSVVIKGELNGSEDLTIEGHVEGKIELRDHVLTIGPNGKIKAELNAKAIVVLGEVIGNVTATEKVDIRENGSVEGDITAPRVAIAEGAHFRGSVDMQNKGAKPAAAQAQAPRPAAPTPVAQPQGQPSPQAVVPGQQRMGA